MEFHSRRSADSGAAAVDPFGVIVAVAAGVLAQPAATKSALVSSNGAATNSSTLKINANAIELAAAAVPPRFNSSFERFCFGIGNNPGTPPVIPAKSPSPSITAGVKATSTSAASASTNASLAE